MALYIGNKKYCAVVNANLNNQDIIVTENGNYTPSIGYSGFGLVRVQIPDPILDTLTVNPSTSSQTFNPTHYGYSTVTVNPVTAAIDTDITAGNIKKGVNILGVTGTLEFTTEELTVTPTTAQQIKTPTKNGYSKVTVGAVTSAIDSNIKAANIKSGVTILGVTGTCVQSVTTTRTITSNGTFTPPDGYTGFSSVTVNKVADLEDLTINPSTSDQTFTSTNHEGYGTVTANKVTAAIDSNIKATNIKSGVTILGVTGSVTELKGETKTITANGTYTPSSGKNGFTSVTVNVNTVNNQTKTITANGTYTPDAGYTGFSSVTVDINTVNNTTLTVTPTTSQQVKTPATGYTGFSSVTINPVTSAIDSNIKAENIKSGVTILGVAGTLSPSQTTTLTVTEEGTYTPSAPYTGYSSVTVDLSWIQEKLEALNAGDVSTSSEVTLQDKTFTAGGTFTADAGYDGFGTITIDLDWVDAKINQILGQQVSTSVDDFLNGSTTAFTSDVLTVKSYACYYQMNLTQATLNNATIINEYAFANSQLNKLILRSQTMCDLTSTTALEGTPIASGSGDIYVPDALVNTYKTATNWNFFSDRIKAISTL